MFEQELRGHVGEQVQVVTPLETVSGLLIAVTDTAVTIRTAAYPGYGGAQDAAINLDTISYVRLMQ